MTVYILHKADIRSLIGIFESVEAAKSAAQDFFNIREDVWILSENEFRVWLAPGYAIRPMKMNEIYKFI